MTLQSTLLSILLFMLPCFLGGQEYRYAGSHPPDPAVIQFIEAYRTAVSSWKTIEERDKARQELISSGYFYHGLDGHPIDFHNLDYKSPDEKIKVQECHIFDISIYQYAHTAMVTYKTQKKGIKDGEDFESVSSFIVVLGVENGKWKILADIMGRPPKPDYWLGLID